MPSNNDMRVLVANIPLPANRFLVDLNSSLKRHAEVVQDHDAFWNMQGDYDVVHLHFPEYITFEMQDAYRETLSDELIKNVDERLRYWGSRSSLVITRHVLLPHSARSDRQWERMYETVYRNVDGVVHFAEPSVREFQERYADVDFIRGQPAHCIIPHHNYASLPNTTSRLEARKKLGISKTANVLLAFGAIRGERERNLVLNTFQGISIRNKVLVASRWPEKLANVSWIRLKYWLRDFARLYYKLNPRYLFNYGFVQEQDTQLYLNAADVLFIPRLHVLNSGNITLGMTFGKVVVGPDSLDVGHLLKTTGNIVFDPDKPETAVAAVEQAFDFSEKNILGPANRKLALSEWSAEQCAEQYFNFFTDIKRVKTQP